MSYFGQCPCIGEKAWVLGGAVSVPGYCGYKAQERGLALHVSIKTFTWM